MTARVAVVGVNGHGRWHLDNIARLQAKGVAELAAACDVAPVGDAAQALISGLGAKLHTSFEAMLAATEPDVVVLATPPATHLPLAAKAMDAGADVLVEKPPTVRLADLDALIEKSERDGRLVQIGFQSSGSHALERIAALVRDGVIGPLRHVYAAGAWIRPRAYFKRAAWAGRRFLDGVAVGDGAIANPFGHALMNCVRIADVGTHATVEAELWHANDIESDDVSSLRIIGGGAAVSLAVTLCADQLVEPYAVAVGEHATARWEYTRDALWVDGTRVALPEARDLLEDLIDARRSGRVPICPPSRCRAFMEITTQLLDVPAPARIPAEFTSAGDPIVVPGVTALVERAAASCRLLSEAGAPWASH